jgi:hypothetical protein
MVEIQWEEPGPKPQNHNLIRDEILPVLRENPGRWAVVKEFANRNTCSASKAHYRTQYPEFEWESRGTKLFARFLGAVRRAKA